LKEHLLAWNVEGRILSAPLISTWWLPYDLNAIMRFGHTANTDIPEDPDEAEFPPLPWEERVVIRVKSQAPPAQPLAPLPADDDPQGSPSAPGLPATWTGPAFGQALPISADTVALTNYHSPYETRVADQEPEEDVHSLISWTTRKDYPTWIGISLPIRDFVGTDYHEIQFWEDPAEPIQFPHTIQGVYDWLTARLRERSGNANRLPIGMPEAFENLSVVTYRTGKEGPILFTLLNSFANSLRDQPVKV
jgi:hypothetical protein